LESCPRMCSYPPRVELCLKMSAAPKKRAIVRLSSATDASSPTTSTGHPLVPQPTPRGPPMRRAALRPLTNTNDLRSQLSSPFPHPPGCRAVDAKPRWVSHSPTTSNQVPTSQACSPTRLAPDVATGHRIRPPPPPGERHRCLPCLMGCQPRNSWPVAWAWLKASLHEQ
jgi:hypothetical protein